MELLYLYFPGIYDAKYMMTAVEGMHGGRYLIVTLNYLVSHLHACSCMRMLLEHSYYKHSLCSLP